MNYQLDGNNIFVNLDKGEYIKKSLQKIIEINKFYSGCINGIGAIENPEIGYYSLKEKKYYKKVFEGDYELISLVGNISKKDDCSFLHIHITFSDTKFNVYGGHLFDSKILVTGEFFIYVGKTVLNRKYSSEISLPLWCLENKFID